MANRARRRPAVPVFEMPNRHGIYRKADAISEEERGKVINDGESILRELEWLGVLSARQREAGEKFEEDYRACYPVATRDILDISPKGMDHETDAAAERIKRSAERCRKVKVIAGGWYAGVRDLIVFRKRLRLAAQVLPDVLTKVAGDVYGLP